MWNLAPEIVVILVCVAVSVVLIAASVAWVSIRSNLHNMCVLFGHEVDDKNASYGYNGTRSWRCKHCGACVKEDGDSLFTYN